MKNKLKLITKKYVINTIHTTAKIPLKLELEKKDMTIEKPDRNTRNKIDAAIRSGRSISAIIKMPNGAIVLFMELEMEEFIEGISTLYSL